MQIMTGRMWSNGKMCFLLQVRRILAIATIPRDDDPPEATSAIEAHRYRVQSCGKIYARPKVASHLTSTADTGSCSLDLEKFKQRGMLAKYVVLHEVKSQAMKIAKFCTTC